jgi:hypothetical protein
LIQIMTIQRWNASEDRELTGFCWVLCGLKAESSSPSLWMGLALDGVFGRVRSTKVVSQALDHLTRS